MNNQINSLRINLEGINRSRILTTALKFSGDSSIIERFAVNRLRLISLTVCLLAGISIIRLPRNIRIDVVFHPTFHPFLQSNFVYHVYNVYHWVYVSSSN